MKKIIISMFALLAVCGTASAQWVTFDPSNLAQSIVNATKNIVQTSTTATNMVNNFKETVKIFEQGKEYYDALKKVTNLVKDARKVQQTIVMVGDITEIYVTNFQKMLADENFTVAELAAIANGYAKLLSHAGDMLKDLKEVVTSGNGLSMSDRERMEIIDHVHKEVSQFKNLTNYYTRKNISVSFVRASESGSMSRVAMLYGSDDQRQW